MSRLECYLSSTDDYRLITTKEHAHTQNWGHKKAVPTGLHPYWLSIPGVQIINKSNIENVYILNVKR